MSGPFKVGDVVVCVDVSTPPIRPTDAPDKIAVYFAFLRLGGLYKVSSTPESDTIRLVGDPMPYGGYWIERFRHLPKADEQFTADMRACRPIREGQPACPTSPARSSRARAIAGSSILSHSQSAGLLS